MAISRWSLVRFVHVLAAMCWVGGQLFLSVVVLPVLRVNVAPDVRGPIIRRPAEVTPGTSDDLGYGRLLGTKLVLVVISIALAAAHGVLVLRRPQRARHLAIAGLATSLGIVVFATALVP